MNAAFFINQHADKCHTDYNSFDNVEYFRAVVMIGIDGFGDGINFRTIGVSMSLNVWERVSDEFGVFEQRNMSDDDFFSNDFDPPIDIGTGIGFSQMVSLLKNRLK